MTSRVSTKAGISQLKAIRVPERNPPMITFVHRSFSYRIGTIFYEVEFSIIEYVHVSVMRIIPKVLPVMCMYNTP